jgi:two-component system response regulator HydG
MQVDVRVVAATNKDLMQEVEAGRYRLDLYYRLNVISLHLPTLRERPEDIPLLVAHFLRKYTVQNNKQVSGVEQQVLQYLQRADWPGNVRELENVIERAVVLAKDSIIGLAELPAHFQEKEPPVATGEHFALPRQATLAEIEREAIVQALQHSGGNRQATARSLNIGLATLYRKLKEYRLQ